MNSSPSTHSFSTVSGDPTSHHFSRLMKGKKYLHFLSSIQRCFPDNFLSKRRHGQQIPLVVDTCVLSRLSQAQLDETVWTAAFQASLSTGSPGVGCHALLQGIFPTQGSNPSLLLSPALSRGFFTTSATWDALKYNKYVYIRELIITPKMIIFGQHCRI